jgi:hypothetical protein
MRTIKVYNGLNYLIAAVWLINGLFCKMLNRVPRHKEIVARILNTDQVSFITFMIGVGEVLMAIWILTGIRTRFNAVTQIIVIAVMNTLEFFLTPDLLLWGKANAIFAFLFILLIYYREFHLSYKITQQTACYHS